MNMKWLHRVALAAALLVTVSCYSSETFEDWRKDIGKPAPRLMASGWVGTPVSLDALRGNTVVIAFWNGDVAC